MTDVWQAFSAITSLFFSAIAVYFTWRVYKRENTINNENFLYQKTFESHTTLFVCAVDYLDIAEEVFALLNLRNKKSNPIINEEFDKLMTNFELVEQRFETELLKQSVILPEKILDEYYGMLYNETPYPDVNNISNWDKIIDICYQKLDSIQELIIIDLKIRELNNNIVKRIGEFKKSKRISKS